MKFALKKAGNIVSDTLVCFLYEDDKSKSALFDKLDKLSGGLLSDQIYKYQIASLALCETFKVAINKNRKVLIVGLGKKEKLTRKKFSQCIVAATKAAKNITKNSSIAFEVIEKKGKTPQNHFNKADGIKIMISAIRIGLYEFSKYLSDKKPTVELIELLSDEVTNELETAKEIGACTSFAMKFAKDLVNESAQIVTPSYVATLAKEIAKEHKLEAEILNVTQIKERKMNAFLAVGQGSVNQPKFVHLTYRPSKIPRKKIALIGKGITFDAGGMNIKTAASMLTMKSDMTGAASVLGIIQAIAQLRADVELHIVSALCENMTSGSAYKQGDVLTAMNGKTIEVDNTDAEGRITLADALCFCDTLGVDEVIDIATLTGAVIVSLGHNITGVMGNNQKQISKFMECAELSAENVWQMPILDELKDNLKSEIADFKNTGGRNAGTSTAAWFLSNFTKSKSWMHLDIAGTAYLEKSNKETSFGPTGVMIRSLIDYILS